jgi:hypothetical protein
MTKERWEKRNWIPYDPEFPQWSDCSEPSFSDAWGKADEQCGCGKPATIVWHFTKEKSEILDSFCERCASSLAMGLLRDVAEVTFGNKIAMDRYQDAIKRLNLMFKK